MRSATLLAVVVAVLLAACSADGDAADGGTVPLRISTAEGTATLDVEIADTPDERSEGLSNRTSLAEDGGMAFVWDEPVQARFWMKDTLIPLQIAFWGEDDAVLALFEMIPCEAEPCETYGPDEPFVGAVEANAGWFTEHGVEVGDTVELDA
jgi:hypothetical protein